MSIYFLKIITSDRYSLKSKLKMIKCYFYPEFRAVLQIFLDYPHLEVNNNNIFFKRLCLYPETFTYPFWKNHPDLATFEKFPELEGSILDFGCGTGHLDILLARKGRTIHGIDLNPLAITIANSLRESEIEQVKKNLFFSEIDVTKNASNTRYDVIWSNHVFEHIYDPSPILLALNNWAEKNAFILITVPLGLAYDDPDHIHHFFSREQLYEHFGNFMDIRKIEISEDTREIHLLGCLI